MRRQHVDRCPARNERNYERNDDVAGASAKDESGGLTLEAAGQILTPRGTAASPKVIFFIVASVMSMGAIDQTIVSTALPTLQHQLHTQVSWTGWTITTYQLGQTVAMPVSGRISDQFGRKRVFLVAIVIFTLASLACGLSTNIYELVAFRALQALGGGAFMPSATGIVADTFGKNRDRAIGMFTSIVPIGSMVGPVIGGVMISYWTWRGVFLVNIPIGIIGFTLAYRTIPTSTRKDTGPADYLGMALIAFVILPMMYGITELGSGHTRFDSPHFLIPEAIAALFVWIYIRHAHRAEVPIINIRLLRTRNYFVVNLIACIYGGCALGIGTLVPLYGEDRYHLAPVQVGSLLTARAVGVISLAAITAFAIRRIGYRVPMMFGFSAAALGMFLLSVHPLFFGPYGWLAFASAILGIGVGVAAPATNNATLSQNPTEIASTAALRGAVRQIGGIVSISIATAYASRSVDPGIALSHVFIVFSLILLVIVNPLVWLLPDQRGSW